MSEHGTSDHRHGHRRRKRRHRRGQPISMRTKIVIAICLFSFLLVVAGIFSAFQNMWTGAMKVRQQVEMNQFVSLTGRTVIIMNPTEKDWGFTTVRLNDEYVANCPELPKGMQFEIFFKQFRGTNGYYDPTTQKVDTVKIEPQGVDPIVWFRVDQRN